MLTNKRRTAGINSFCRYGDKFYAKYAKIAHFSEAEEILSIANDDREFVVVVNHEEQYSTWPAGQDLPPGWRNAGVSGPMPVCLAHIEKVWVDMRPLSLRKMMEKAS